MQAKRTAEKATAPNKLPQTIAAIAMITIPIGIVAYVKINNRKRKKLDAQNQSDGSSNLM